MSSTQAGMQNQLNHLKNEADRLYLSVNLDKTNTMFFSYGWTFGCERKMDLYMAMKRSRLQMHIYKYLGMTFTTKLVCFCFNSESYEKIGFLRPYALLEAFWFSERTNAHLCCWSLGPRECKPNWKSANIFAMKRFLSVPLHSSNKLLYGETGRYPLFIRTAVKCIKYWVRLIKLPVARLCRQTYNMLLIQNNQGRISWVFKVQQIFNENGFEGCVAVLRSWLWGAFCSRI